MNLVGNSEEQKNKVIVWLRDLYDKIDDKKKIKQNGKHGQYGQCGQRDQYLHKIIKNASKHNSGILNWDYDLICLSLLNYDKFGNFKDLFISKLIKLPTPPTVPMHIYSWIIFGCPLSSDIDVILLTTSEYYINGSFIGTYNLEKIGNWIKRVYLRKRKINMTINFDHDKNILYLNNRPLDVSLGILKNNKIIYMTKGCQETTNPIIHATFKYHPQVFKNNPIADDFENEHPLCRLNSISKYIFQNYKVLFPQHLHDEISKFKAHSFKNDIKRNNYMFSLLPNIDILHLDDYFGNNGNMSDKIDVVKSLTIKLSQFLLLMCGKMAFTRELICHNVNLLYPGIGDAVFFRLSRGKWSTNIPQYDCFPLLLDVLREYMTIVPPPLSWSIHNFNDDVLQHFSETYCSHKHDHVMGRIIREFFLSPAKPSEDFKNMFKNKFPDRDFSDAFMNECSPSSQVPEWLSNSVFVQTTYPQRSKEWKEIWSRYNNPSFVPDLSSDDWISKNYPLIRGCIIELLVQKCFCFDGKPIIISFMLKNNNFIAPDLLVINNVNDPGKKRITVVEIKALMMPPNMTLCENSNDYLRELSLATQQVVSAVKMIGTEHADGALLFVHIYYENKQWNFTPHYAKVPIEFYL